MIAECGTTLQSLYNFPLQRPAGSFCQPFAPGNWLNGFPRMILSILAIGRAKEQIISGDLKKHLDDSFKTSRWFLKTFRRFKKSS